MPARLERSCVVCRKSAPKRELLRVVWDGEMLQLDLQQKAAGRGGYLHRDCLAKDPAQWERALRLGRGKVTKEMLARVINVTGSK